MPDVLSISTIELPGKLAFIYDVMFLGKSEVGALFSMKGRAYDPAAERFAEACEALGAEVEATAEYTLCGEQKHLIICRKTQDTPAQYPRRFAKIKRSPL